MRIFFYIILAGSLLLSGCKTTQLPSKTFFRGSDLSTKGWEAEKAGDYELAESYYLQGISEEPDNFQAYMMLGRMFVEQQAFDKAEEIYNRALLRDPNHSTLHNHIGGFYARKGRALQSKEDSRRALKHYQIADRQNKNSMIQFNKGVVWMDIGNERKAISYYKKSIKLDKCYRSSHINLTHIYLKRNNYKAITKLLQPAVDKDCKHRDLYLDLSSAYHKLGKYEQAINVLNQYLQIDSLDAGIYGSLSYYYIFAKDYEKSKQAATKGFEIDKKKNWIKANFALALLLQGNYEESKSIFLKLTGRMCFEDRFCDEVWLADFDELEKANVIPENQKANVEKIRQMLRNSSEQPRLRLQDNVKTMTAAQRETLFLDAVQNRDLETARRLLELYPVERAQDEENRTAFDIALLNGDLEFVKLLVEYEADKISYLYREGNWNPIHIALRSDNADLIDFLIENNKFSLRDALNVTFNTDNELVKRLVENGKHKEEYERELATVMYRYYLYGSGDRPNIIIRDNAKELIKVFIEHGAAIDYKQIPLSTALHEDMDFAKYLVEFIDVNDRASVLGEQLISLSFWHGMNNDARMRNFRFFVEYGADVNTKDKSGSTILMGAVRNRSIEIVRFLIEHGADIHAKDTEGNTVFMHIGGADITKKAEYLRGLKLDIHAKNNEGKNTLEIAIENNSYELIVFLLKNGAKTNNLYYIENPKKCACGKCRGTSGEYFSLAGHLAKHRILMILETDDLGNHPVCLCEGETVGYNSILPVEEGMKVKPITKFCACGDADEENYCC
jgi:ankyrin repeat protein/Tfp pilus assembly protein PilF